MAGALWYWHRFRAMNMSELWHRIMERIGKITEPFARSEIGDARITQDAADCPALPLREDAPALLRQTLSRDAENFLDGKWLIFGWKEVQVSSPPDWHRDYMRGVSVPVKGKLNHRTLPDGADVRTIWEINRWAEPVRLAMHGWLNDDASAMARAQSWLADWVEKNPIGQGINWTSALEGGLRLINFCWFDAFASQMEGGASKIDRQQWELRSAIIPSHVWWVKRNLSFGSSANNHRLGELTGLLLAVKRWPEMESIAGSAEELWQQIAECVLAQFAEDGGNREQALHYHLFAFEMALHACRAMKVTDGPVVERLQRAAEFFVRMSHPQEPWDYGDNDDAQIVPMTMRRENAVAEWGAWMCGGDDALSYWLVVPPSGGTGNMIPPEGGTTNNDWWLAQESGMAVIERDGWKVRVDASPMGFGKMAAHGHCDALHVSIWDGEHALVIDPGTGGYFGSKELRAELASWNAHNGPQPTDGFKTPRRLGIFLWAGHHEKPLVACDDNRPRISLCHENFYFSRTLKIVDGELVIEDTEKQEQSFRERWTFTPDCQVFKHQSEPSTFVLDHKRSKIQWLIKLDGCEDMRLSSRVGSPAFGCQIECPVIEFHSKTKSVARIRRHISSHLM